MDTHKKRRYTSQKEPQMIKKLSYSVAVVVVLLLGYDGWNMHINNNFGTISPNKVYKSRAIDADDIGSYIDKYNIKTVIDLRDTQNQKTNILL